VETGNDIDDTSGGGSDVVDGYEQLRARALGGDIDGWRLGLEVLQQRGVAAWLQVRRATVPNISPPVPAPAASPLTDGVEAELVGLLASMVLAVAARG
jgi:hypothetical protein